jgi:hypothetical protein
MFRKSPRTPRSRVGSFEALESRQLLATIDLVSANADGIPADNYPQEMSSSANGRYVAFVSDATNLVANDNKQYYDVFVKDMQTGGIVLASSSTTGEQPNGDCREPAISANGRYVVFTSTAQNLLTGQTNPDYSNIFRKDLETGELLPVSVRADGGLGNGRSNYGSISADGRFVAFYSSSRNLVGQDNNNNYDVFLKDMKTGGVALVDHTAAGAASSQGGSPPHISADGNYVLFNSRGADLVAEDKDQYYDAFRYHRIDHAIELVSTDPPGGTPYHDVSGNGVSTDGSRVLLFHANKPFVKDLTSQAEFSIHNEPGQFGFNAVMSADGEFVAFDFFKSHYSRGGVFVQRISTGNAVLVSRTAEDVPVTGDVSLTGISPNGEFVFFQTNRPLTPNGFGYQLFRTERSVSPIVTVNESVRYTASQAPQPIAPELKFSDDPATLQSRWTATVAVTGQADPADTLSIRNQGTAPGQVGVSGNTITYGGVAVGTFSPGSFKTPLTISIDPGTSLLGMQAILRNITFASTTANTAVVNRVVRFTVVDSDGLTSRATPKRIVVLPRLNAPVLILSGATSYTSRRRPAILAGNATMTGVIPANFAGSQLTIAVTKAAEATDRLSVRNNGTAAGQIGVSGSTITFGGQTIGIASGGSGITPLTIKLYAAATPAAVQELLRNVQYTSTARVPFAVDRTVEFNLVDGEENVSNSPAKIIHVFAPTVLDLGSPAVAARANRMITLAPQAMVTFDPRTNFHGGKLSVWFDTDGSFGAQILLTDFVRYGDSAVRVNDRTIGYVQVEGHIQPEQLSIRFTDAATSKDVLAVLRAIRFKAGDAIGSRDVHFALSDNNGGMSAATKTVVIRP